MKFHTSFTFSFFLSFLLFCWKCHVLERCLWKYPLEWWHGVCSDECGRNCALYGNYGLVGGNYGAGGGKYGGDGGNYGVGLQICLLCVIIVNCLFLYNYFQIF